MISYLKKTLVSPSLTPHLPFHGALLTSIPCRRPPRLDDHPKVAHPSCVATPPLECHNYPSSALSQWEDPKSRGGWILALFHLVVRGCPNLPHIKVIFLRWKEQENIFWGIGESAPTQGCSSPLICPRALYSLRVDSLSLQQGELPTTAYTMSWVTHKLHRVTPNSHNMFRWC